MTKAYKLLEEIVVMAKVIMTKAYKLLEEIVVIIGDVFSLTAPNFACVIIYSTVIQ